VSISTTDLDNPEVITAVAAAFGSYEQALAAGDVDLLMAFFWDSSEVVRFGVADEQWGTAQLLEWRLANPGVPAGRTLSRTRISTFGPDTAVVSTLFTHPDGTALGRQSQTWRLMDGAWRIVHAHVSHHHAGNV
jgi:hypothetical protein